MIEVQIYLLQQNNQISLTFEKKTKRDLNNPSFHIEKLDKQEKNKYKANRPKEIIKTRAEIKDIEKRKIEKINEIKHLVSL